MTPQESVNVWYIRHGENPANLTGELSYRRVDSADRPRRRAGAGTGRPVVREPAPAAIYASPLRRAAQTAQILATRLGLPVCTLEELRELDVGDLEGRSDEGAWELFLEVARAWTPATMPRLPRRRGLPPGAGPAAGRANAGA